MIEKRTKPFVIFAAVHTLLLVLISTGCVEQVPQTSDTSSEPVVDTVIAQDSPVQDSASPSAADVVASETIDDTIADTAAGDQTAVTAAGNDNGDASSSASSNDATVAAKAEKEWKPLFDGKTLDGWETPNFGGEGDVTVEEGHIVLDFGASMTGISWTKEFPKTNYEISLEASRDNGTDFFCGLTFPVEDSHCSLILGGWGGAIVGLSSVDGSDASDNSTTQAISFKNKQWYKVRVKVTPATIECWLDDKKIITQKVPNYELTIRSEVDLCKPLGIASWDTRAHLRNIRMRRVK